MYHYHLYLIFIALLVGNAVGAASVPSRTDGVRIVSSTTAILISNLVSNDVCAHGLMYITSDGCAHIVAGDGTAVASHCDSGNYAGLTSLQCTLTACHGTNPTNGNIVAIDPSTGTFIRTYGVGLTQPTTLAAYEDLHGDDTGIETFVFDASTNNAWLFRLDGGSSFTTALENSQIIYNSTSTAAPLGIALANNDTLYFQYVGDTSINQYSYTPDPTAYSIIGAATPFLSGFTNLQKIFFIDEQRLYVYDTDCSCVKIYAWRTKTLYETVPTTNGIKSITSSKNYFYVLDNSGILQFGDPFQLVSVTKEDVACADQGGTFIFYLKGGAFPINAYIYPDNQDDGFIQLEATYAMAFGLLYPIPDLANWTVFIDDTIPDFYIRYGVNLAYELDNVTSHSGNASYAIQFQSQSTNIYGEFGWSCSYQGGCITDLYSAVEFYINFGDGGQEILFSLLGTDVHHPIYSKVYNSTDFTNPNSWNLIHVDFPMGHQIDTLFFTDNIKTADPQNYWYIDDVVLIPMVGKSRTAYFTDACGATVNVTDLVLTYNQTFSASLTSTPVTCNIGDFNDGAHAADGTITAVHVNGEGPFEYDWIFPNIDTSNKTVYNISAMSPFITIYDNAVNSSGWVDTSSIDNRNMSDTSRYVSPPCSISMTAPENADTLGISFTVHPPMNVNSNSRLTFWVNGGDIGGQRLNLVITKYALALHTVDLFTLLPPNTPWILPNKWMQLTFNFPNSVTSFTEISIQVNGFNAEQAQPTIYFDDFILNVDPTVIVTDTGLGCQVFASDVTVGAPPPLTVVTSVVNSLCFNSSDGNLKLNVSGGVAPYTYTMTVPTSRTQQSPYPVTIDSLPEMNAVVDITDSNTCKLQEISVPILQPPMLDFTITSEPIQCQGGSTTMTSYITGGMAPYTYSWSSSAPIVLTPQASPTTVFADTLSNIFTISSNLKLQCLGTGSHLNLAYPPSHAGYCSLAATFTTANPAVSFSTCTTCFSTIKYAGVGFWIYLTSVQDAQNMFVTLFNAGSPVSTPVSVYTLGTIVAGQWNEVYYNTSYSSVTNPDQIVISTISPTTVGRVLIDDVVLFPAVASSIGVGVYSGFKSIVTGPAALYFLSVVDGNGCSYVKKFTIPEPAALSVTAEVQSASDITVSDGSIVLNGTGGTPPYTYLWLSNNATNTSLHGLAAGEQTVVITDANGCQATANFFVDVEARLKIRAYNKGLSSGLGAITGVATVIALFALVMLFMFWTSHTKLGTFYSFVVTTGVLISYVAVIVLLPRPTDALCTAFPWLLGIAFTLVYGCLFLKTWALYRVWIKAIHYQKATLTTFDIVRSLSIALIIEVILLAVWTAKDPPHAALVKVVGSTYELQCTTHHSTFWIIFVCMKGVWLLFGAILSILTRNVMKEYNESTSIAYAIYNILVLLVIAIPLAALLGVVPGGRLVIEVVVPVLAFTSTLVIMFFKIWHASLFTNNEIKLPGMRVTAVSPANTTYSGGSNGSPSNTNSINSYAEQRKSVQASSYSASVS